MNIVINIVHNIILLARKHAAGLIIIGTVHGSSSMHHLVLWEINQ